jgi:hypothetical protein
LLAFAAAGIGFGLGAAFADGDWQDWWLNLLAETIGAAFIVLFVDRLLERSKEKEREQRRRAAIKDLGYVLEELELWLVRLLQESELGLVRDPEQVPVATLVDGLPAYLGRIDFAAPGPYKRDRYFVAWARRSFDRTVIELARWEQNFAGAAGSSTTISAAAPSPAAQLRPRSRLVLRGDGAIHPARDTLRARVRL